MTNKCEHKFQTIHRAHNDFLFVHHGECSNCGIDMVRMGRLDKNGNGIVNELIGENNDGKLYQVKSRIVIRDV